MLRFVLNARILHLVPLILVSAAIMNATASAATGRTTRPNVLWIYTDDHRYTGVHALGGQAVQTPYIDQLAAEGLVFTNTYLMGSFSGATCIPSRANLLTGRHLFALDGIGHHLPPDHTTAGEAFRAAGYHSHIVGKWHQDNASLARSFDSGTTLMGLGRYLADQYRMPLWDWDPSGRYDHADAYRLVFDTDGTTVRRPLSDEDRRGPIGDEFTGPHVSEIFADGAIDFLEAYDGDDPFFMYLAFCTPHDPRQAPKDFKDMYPENEVELPPSCRPQHPFDNGHMMVRDEELAPWPRTPEIARQHLSDYYAIISHLDAQIGRVIQSLKDRGLYGKTLIVFAGDSGLAVGCHGLMGKQSVYDEDGVHIPFIISGGAAPERGRRIDALSYIHDILPTTCDLVGVPTPETATGKSLVPVIEGRVPAIRDHTYHAYRQHQRAYREGDYKLIEYVRAPDSTRDGRTFVAGSRVTQLFNIAEDPWETTDLSIFPDYQERVEQMRSAMMARALDLGDNTGTTGEEVDFWDHFGPDSR
jgi:arylsulfatase A-like enzyme